MQKILVTIDGSESCQKAAYKARELALLCRSNVTFITIVKSKFKIVTSRTEFEEKQREKERQKKASEEFLNKCEDIYESCKDYLNENNLKTERVVKEGNYPALDICDYAEKNNFDLIVISDKGKSNIKKYLLGGTTEKVVRHSSTSVLVVK